MSAITEDLDDVDRRIVDLLRADGRLSNKDLADAVGIAASTCVARTKALRDRGVLAGFTAIVPPESVGLGIESVIQVTIRPGARQRIREFHEDMAALTEVRQIFFLAGVDDFILHVVVTDTAALRDFVVEHLSEHTAVASTRTSLVFQHEDKLTAPLFRTSEGSRRS